MLKLCRCPSHSGFFLGRQGLSSTRLGAHPRRTALPARLQKHVSSSRRQASKTTVNDSTALDLLESPTSGTPIPGQGDSEVSEAECASQIVPILRSKLGLSLLAKASSLEDLEKAALWKVLGGEGLSEESLAASRPEAAKEIAAGSVLGAVALILGSTIGAGILALPAVAAPAGFGPSTAVLVGCWLLLSLDALLIAEVNLSIRWVLKPDATQFVCQPYGQSATGGQKA